jgi:uncharacterized protein YndB with AHSA1/START domain
MSSATETTSLERVIAIDATPETVWEFLVEPEKMVRWMGMAASLDPRPGGAYRCEVIPGHTARGEVVEVEPPHRLVFTWGWEPGEGAAPVPPGSSTIEIELESDGTGTRLRFVHSGLPNAENVQSHGHGWDHYLERLPIAASGGDPGPDPWISGEM